MKSIALEQPFLPTFFGCSKKVGRKARMLFKKRHATAKDGGRKNNAGAVIEMTVYEAYALKA